MNALAPFSSVSLSHSRKQVMITCGKKYQFMYVDRYRPKLSSHALRFGSAMHSACSALLTAQAFGVDLDVEPLFVHAWQQAVKEGIKFSSAWDEEKLDGTGRRLIQLFQEDWPAREWTPVMDADGLPIIERILKVTLPGNIEYTVVIDAVVQDALGNIIVLDFKTPADPSDVGFSGISDQLIGYQVAMKTHAAALGIDPDRLKGVVFYELVKKPIPKSFKGKGPYLVVDNPTPWATPERVNEWISEQQFVARDIRDKRFNRRPMDSYNSPCELCDMKDACWNQDFSGLVKEEKMCGVGHKALVGSA